MCFTINIHTTRNAIEKRFDADASLLNNFDFRYFYRAFENPLIPVIMQNEPGKVQLLRWGLIPHWARDKVHADRVRKGTYNARAESLGDKPSFRKPVVNQRCIVIAAGFYEWQHISGQKIPWHIQHADHALFGIAGIFDLWNEHEHHPPLITFSVITTRANPLMEKIHNTKKRMPVILNQQLEKDWMRQDLDEEERKKILQPAAPSALSAYTISKKISSPGTDPQDPEVIKPVDTHTHGTLF